MSATWAKNQKESSLHMVLAADLPDFHPDCKIHHLVMTHKQRMFLEWIA
jgi:hypothetical protein